MCLDSALGALSSLSTTAAQPPLASLSIECPLDARRTVRIFHSLVPTALSGRNHYRGSLYEWGN